MNSLTEAPPWLAWHSSKTARQASRQAGQVAALKMEPRHRKQHEDEHEHEHENEDDDEEHNADMKCFAQWSREWNVWFWTARGLDNLLSWSSRVQNLHSFRRGTGQNKSWVLGWWLLLCTAAAAEWQSAAGSIFSLLRSSIDVWENLIHFKL